MYTYLQVGQDICMFYLVNQRKLKLLIKYIKDEITLNCDL